MLDGGQALKIILENGLSALFGAVAAYLAIREDLARLKERTEIHGKEISRAHSRIDALMSKGE